MEAFDRFLLENTRPGTPRDCTKLDAAANDCLERNEPASEWCTSCQEYNRVVLLWNEKETKEENRRHVLRNGIARA